MKGELRKDFSDKPRNDIELQAPVGYGYRLWKETCDMSS